MISSSTRQVLGIVAGIVTAMAVILLVETAGHAISGGSAMPDVNNVEALAAYGASLPLGSLLSVLVAWVGGTAAGVIAGSIIAPGRSMFIASVVGAVVLLSAIAQVLQFPHPTWLVVSSMIGIPVAAFLTARAMQR
jgi:hypothetical protein